MDLAKDSVVPTVYKLAIPMMIAQIVNMMYNIVDRIFVGNIENVGTQALAALGVCFPISQVISSFSQLIGQGAVPLATIKLGEKNVTEANLIFNNSITALIFVGVVLTTCVEIWAREILLLFGCPDDSIDFAVTFLRYYSAGTIFMLFSLGLNPFITAQGHSYYSMATVCIGAILNIIFDVCLITVGKLGIKGAGISSLFAQFFSSIFVITFFARPGSVFKFNLKQMIPRKALLKSVLLGISPFVMNITESAIQIVFAVQLNIYTNGNSSYTATITILLSGIQFISYPLSGFSQGAAPFISYNYGAITIDRVNKAIYVITFSSFAFTVMVYTLSMVYPQVYGLIFFAADDVIALINEYGRIFFMGTIMFFAQNSFQSIFVALGQTGISIFLACLRKIILLIPLCFILPVWMGVEGIFISEGISDLAAGITTFICFVVHAPRVLKRQQMKAEYDPI